MSMRRSDTPSAARYSSLLSLFDVQIWLSQKTLFRYLTSIFTSFFSTYSCLFKVHSSSIWSVSWCKLVQQRSRKMMRFLKASSPIWQPSNSLSVKMLFMWKHKCLYQGLHSTRAASQPPQLSPTPLTPSPHKERFASAGPRWQRSNQPLSRLDLCSSPLVLSCYSSRLYRRSRRRNTVDPRSADR